MTDSNSGFRDDVRPYHNISGRHQVSAVATDEREEHADDDAQLQQPAGRHSAKRHAVRSDMHERVCKTRTVVL